MADFDETSLLPAGIVSTRASRDGLYGVWAANGGAPSVAQIQAVTGPAPTYPTGLPRMADSNPEPREG